MKRIFSVERLSLGAAIFFTAGVGHAATHDVDIVNSSFSPRNITIDPGDSVRWTERDGLFHTSTSDTGLWDSGFLTLNGTFTFTFNDAGEYPYHCIPHPFMTGSVSVQGAVNTPPTVTIDSPANNAAFTEPASVDINVTATDSDGNITNVQFLDGTTVLGNDTEAPYTFTANLDVGSHTLTAVATDDDGDSTTSAAVNITVNPAANQPPTVSIDSPANNATFTAPASVTINVTAADTDGNVSNVQFLDGTTVLGTDSEAPYTFTAELDVGNHALTAVATDEDGASTTSSVVNVTVNPPENQPPTVAIDNPANNATFTAPAEVTINVTAADSDGSVTNVQFLEGTTVLGNDTEAPYSFTGTFEAGNHSLTAVATDNAGASTTSEVVMIIVNAAENQPPTVSIANPTNNATFTAPASVTIDVSAADADGSVTNVQFLNGTTILGNDTEAPYSFTGTFEAGNHSLTAVATDNVGASTTSGAVIIIVNGAENQPPIVMINSPTNNATFTAPASVTINVTATDSDGSITTVQFLDGSTVLGNDSEAPYTFTASLGPGSHSLTAIATDNAGASTTSEAVNIVVTGAALVEVSGAVADGTNFVVTWSGVTGPSTGPFAVQRKASLGEPVWMNETVSASEQAVISMVTPAGFFRTLDTAGQPRVPFTAWLNGASERPEPTTSAGEGFGIFSLEGNILTFTITYSGLSGPAVAAHIHGPAVTASNAPPVVDLASFHAGSFSTNGSFSGTVELSAEQKAMLMDGRTYVNVHTGNNPNGEIRGQIAPVLMEASLLGAYEPSNVITPASGLASLTLVGNQLTFNIAYRDLSGPAGAAHFHASAPLGSNAPVAIDLAPFKGGPFGTEGYVNGSTNLNPSQLAAFIDGLAYVNFHTPSNQGGEIRGQVRGKSTAVPLTAHVSGLNEHPALTNSATGHGIFSLEGDLLAFTIYYSGLSGPASAAHIHGPAVTASNAPPIIDLAEYHIGPFGTSGVFSGSVTLSSEQREMILGGLTYFNVHTGANPGGEARGQVVPVLLSTVATGAAERPEPIETDGSALALFTLTGNQLNLNVVYRDLSGTALDAHIHAPADTNAFTGVALGLGSFNGGAWGTSGSLTGSTTISPTVIGYLVDGLSYVNFHTPDHQSGEIRGQIEH